MDKENIKHLFYKYFHDLTTPEENRELARLLAQPAFEEDVKRLMQEAWEVFVKEEDLFDSDTSERMLRHALGTATDHPVAQRMRRQWRFSWNVAAAALLLSTLCAGILLYSDRFSPSTLSEKVVKQGNQPTTNQDFLPGSNKAFLTLADGRDIVLDHAHPGLLTTEGNTRIIKEEGDRLSYEVESGKGTPNAGNNTLRTPRGGQYHLVLPDGTKAWLNAASSITYPVQFIGDSRNVTIEGEAFFEVARQTQNNKRIPFIVTTRDISVEVLGTRFNINAYHDENQIKTTLLEGSVKIHTPKSSSLLDPGQQAAIPVSTADIRISKANTDQAIAWKNGYFQFEQASLTDIMRQLSKWYDIDVRYEGRPLVKTFSGEIPRSATLLQVLEILELNQIQMTIEGKEIIIRT